MVSNREEERWSSGRTRKNFQGKLGQRGNEETNQECFETYLIRDQ